ncbi:hypothetical protein VB712_01120 [Spirulina sp. CCNP1310]|uniref:hypothetical protein n=1 Tax=Spirulina sp. CCNP1310 TaxID=3110249 RepID=UPI002B215949|nr:hypothetical protein [Spirulina sp. CCNP1310]MEA5417803.1 hypothetical protein [Spirulina sp. CCNP1310]
MNYWQQAITIALTSTLGFGSISSAIAQTPPIDLRQPRNLIGQCRQVNQRTEVYSQRGGDEVVGTLERGTEVIIGEPDDLAQQIYIGLPLAGFISTNVLTDCNRTLPDLNTPVGDICVNHRVDPTVGLPIRSIPNPDSQGRDRVFPRERITIINTRIENGIEWLNISHPFEGWIENGNPNTRNFNTTPCSELGL